MTPAEPTLRRSHAAFVYVTIFLDMLAFGIIGPILPKLVETLAHTGVARAALIVGIFGVAWAIMQFFCSPIFGLLSDRIGRRPLILFSNIGTAIDYAIMALAPSIGWLFIGRVLSGATTASTTVAMAYIADSTKPEERAKAFGMVGAAFGLGFIIGPAIGGYLGAFDPRLPFWVAALFGLVNFAYGWFVLPESLAAHLRSDRMDWKKANPLGSLTFLQSQKKLFGLSSIFLFTHLAHEIFPYVWVLYCMAAFAWSSTQIGGTLALVGIVSALSSMILVSPAVKRFGERRTLIGGLAFATIAYVLFAQYQSGPLFLAGIVLSGFSIYAAPLQAILTKRVGPSHQGELQGAISAVRGLMMIAGPPLYTALFWLVTGPYKDHGLLGTPWLFAGILTAIAIPVALRATHRIDDDAALIATTELPLLPE